MTIFILQSMNIASIDIGTNTILLLIVEINNNRITKILHDEQVIARLGKGVDKDKTILPETFQRALSFLQEYKKTCDKFQVEKIIAVGTSALRDAKNRDEFCVFIQQHAGISIEILSGDEEAQWTYRGGIFEFEQQSNNFTVIDIGGGSTEIIFGNKNSINNKISLNIGCVRITERFLHSSPPSAEELDSAKKFITEELQKISLTKIPSLTIGVAGTVTTLAALEQQLLHYEREKISGYELSYNTISTIYNSLKTKTLEEIKQIPQISAGRADIFLAGILILLTFMEKTATQKITVSDWGLRYGVILRETYQFSIDNEQ